MSETKKAYEAPKKVEILRILGTDIPASMNLLYGLSKIKGISFNLSNAICVVLKLDKLRKISDLSDSDIEEIENYLLDPKKAGIPQWLFNKRGDNQSGENLHFVSKDLDFEIIQQKRELFKTKSYKSQRTKLKLPVRGQRTKSNFRRNKMIASMKSKSVINKRGSK
jgi:small subunit ribosomal protein S13